MPVVAEILALLAAGALTGLLSGLLGIGGGVVIVPVLLELFAAQALPEPLRLPLATGTAHAAVLLTSVSAALAHGRAGRVDGRLVRAWLPPLLLGAAGGLVLARVAAPALLAGLFAGVTL
ncbi:MAG: sulfite exporter TauE/SafE family protein, partial [Acetobacteraceae bacterium]|nr:sulfite exporter TauE/SafE family protein [Acetobacteraceae bacterium]